MSSTITYKNNQIASFNTGTKTLKTNGKYMEDDVTVNVSDPNLIATNVRHDIDIFGVSGTFGMKIDTVTTTLSARDTSITFTGLKAYPLFFSVGTTSDITMNRSYRNLINVTYDGTMTHSDTYYLAGGNSGYGRYFTTCTWTYNNGSLTINSAGTGTTGYFYNGTWRLIYCYEA